MFIYAYKWRCLSAEISFISGMGIYFVFPKKQRRYFPTDWTWQCRHLQTRLRSSGLKKVDSRRTQCPSQKSTWLVCDAVSLAACCLLLASDVGDRQLSGDFVLLGFKLGKTSQLRRSKLRRKQELFIRTSMNWEGRDDIASKHWNQNEKGRKKTTAVVS